jgi:hypothetical protein
MCHALTTRTTKSSCTPLFLRKDGNWAAPVSNSYSGVVSSVFTELTDTPSSYSGEQNKFLKCVDPGKLEFAVPSTDELSEGPSNGRAGFARIRARGRGRGSGGAACSSGKAKGPAGLSGLPACNPAII